MDACTEPGVEVVVVMSSAQVGKTEIVNNLVGYHMHQDPSPLLVVQPTLEMAESWSKDRLAPMLRDSPALRGLVKEARSRDANNTLLAKAFPGGRLTVSGANSPASLSSRPVRVVLCDEVDRFPDSAGTEGDPVSLARKRTASYWNRRIVLVSTPTIKSLSRIEAAFLDSDQRRYHVPCPHCGEFQVLQWSGIKWDEGQPETARYFCELCGEQIPETEKAAMLLAGEWRATAPFNGVAGFHMNELISPWRRWGEVAADFLAAKRLGTEGLRVWVNTSLGETWEEQGDGLEPAGLMARLEQYERGDVPILAVTLGCDVQKDRIEASLVGWGKGEEAWLLDHVILAGDTARPEVWQQLDNLVVEVRPHAVAVDSGYNSDQVHAFCGRRRFAFAVKGMAGFARPLIEDARRRAQRLRRAGRKGVRVEPLGVDAGKVTIFSRLRQAEPGPGYIHFPDHVAFDEEYFAQLTAEKLVVKHRFGRPSQEWVQLRPRNEALDCLVYALAALRLANLNLEQLAQRKQASQPTAATAPAAPMRHPGLPRRVGLGISRRPW
jgi:phage terminase large subunit GpA-like protein